jgi:glutamate--cysteine ligase
VALQDWAEEICTVLDSICGLLDGGVPDGPYCRALEVQREGIADPERLPSARMLAEMAASDESYFQYAMRMSREHQDFFVHSRLDDERSGLFEEEARRSLTEQQEIEAADTMSFPDYLEKYFRQSALDPKRLSA